MRPRLLFVDRDFELRLVSSYRQLASTDSAAARASTSPVDAAIIQDLELETVFEAMAAGDAYLHEVARAVLPVSLVDTDAILYRQQVLADCLQYPDVIRAMYRIAAEAVEAERRIWMGLTGRYPDGVLFHSIELLKLWLPQLRRLRTVAIKQNGNFRSNGLRTFTALLERELSDDYLEELTQHLAPLRLHGSLLASARVGQSNKGTRYTLRRPLQAENGWIQRLREWIGIPAVQHSRLTYEIDGRDESGMQALAELQRRAISAVARAVGQSTDHLLAFFWGLRSELGFLVGCLNLRDQLTRKGEAVCLPQPVPSASAVLCAHGLYDAALSLAIPQRVVGNDLKADGKLLLMVTGANKGGKSTLLRAIGQAQLMMQAGMFVPASGFRANVCTSLFTHFKREEEATLRSGKLDEELRRMRAIVERLRPTSMVLMNESFASTNEREGSEIARQIVQAFLDAGVKLIYVTHLFELAESFFRQHAINVLFLRAERRADGSRTFRILEGEPQPTSYAVDLFRRIFEAGEPSAPKTTEALSSELGTGSLIQ